MSDNHFSWSHIKQVAKVGLSLLLLALINKGLTDIFGKDNFITKYFLDNFLLTAYNIVGIILIILFFCGIWVGKEKSKLLYSIISFIMFIPTAYAMFEFVFPKAANKFIETISLIGKIIIITVGIIITFSVVITIILYIKDKKEEKRRIEAVIKRNSHVSNEEIIKQVNTSLEDRKKTLNSINKDADINQNNKITQETISKTDYCFHEIPQSNDDWKIANKRCPQCGEKLVSRTNSYDGTHFLGCANYGRTGCDFTINYHEYHLIRERMGVSK